MTHPTGMNLARVLFCCQPVNGTSCMRKPLHTGGHLPLPKRTPRSACDPIEGSDVA